MGPEFAGGGQNPVPSLGRRGTCHWHLVAGAQRPAVHWTAAHTDHPAPESPDLFNNVSYFKISVDFMSFPQLLNGVLYQAV